MEIKDERIPVTVLTGYLGSGKTTLLNRLLREEHGMRIAVIENEFGEVGVDNQLVVQSDEEIFEMNNGCICCTVRGDLIRILGALARRKQKFDRVLIETTGLADPGPVVQTFYMDEDVEAQYRLDGVVTLVDTRHLPLHLDESQEARGQVAFADVLVFNKTDLVSAEELRVLEERLARMNVLARRMRAVMAEVPLREVLDIGGFDLDRALEVDPAFLGGEPVGAGEGEESHDHDHDHGHDDHDHGHDHAHGHGHAHADDVTSVGLVSEVPLHREMASVWLSRLLQDRGEDIFRMKGVFSLDGYDNRYVFQGVHMLLDGREDRPWGDAPRRTEMVFIGRNLDRDELEQGLRACEVK